MPPPLGDLTIPSSRVPDWINPGISGGIPNTSGWPVIDVTQAPYNADNTGVVAAQGAIQAAVNDASGTSSIVFLPAGTYKFTGKVKMYAKRDLVVKGAGRGQTIIRHFQSNTYGQFSFDDFQLSRLDSEISISSGATRGSTVITMASSPGWVIGDWIQVETATQPSFFDEPQDGQGLVQLMKVANVAGATITLERPLRHDFSPYSPRAKRVNENKATRVGFENFTTEYDSGWTTGTAFPGLHAVANIDMMYAFDCWVKNCELKEGANDSIILIYCSQVTIEHCDIHGQINPESGYGVTLSASCENEVVNNVIYDKREGLTIQRSSCGNVWAYNLTFQIHWPKDIFSHGEYPFENLFEGNDAAGLFQMDKFWGQQGPYNTYYRNRIRGGTGSQIGSSFEVENLFGNPSGLIHQFPQFMNNSCWRFTTQNGTGNFDTRSEDMWVEKNTYRMTGGLPLGEGVRTTDVDNVQSDSPPGAWSGFNFPASLYQTTGVPAWWPGNKPWPMIGAELDDHTSSPENLTTLPAEDWFNGVEGDPILRLFFAPFANFFVRAQVFGDGEPPPPPDPSGDNRLFLVR